jgi:iron complex outermembrane recepter protein
MMKCSVRAPRKSALAQALALALVLPFASAAMAQATTGEAAKKQDAKKTEEKNSEATAPAAGKAAATDIGTVQVTGSRIKRVEIEGPSPVLIISSEQMEREGFTTVFDALETLTQNTGGDTQNELNSAGGFTPNGSPINLRGLGPGRTLLLINGRRAADYPFPYNGQSNFQNFGNLPSAAVERVEILSGGGSAIYGSDAVAGVVNVILKTNFDGNVLKVRAGSTTEGGGSYGDIEWVGGKTADNWNVTYAFQYFTDSPIFGFQRDFMDSTLDNPRPARFIGIQPTATMLLRRNIGGNQTGTYIAPRAGACEQLGDEWVRFNFRSATNAGVITNLGPACGSYKNPAYQTITNGNSDLAGYVYGTYDFSGGLRGWASLSVYDSKSKLTGGTEFLGGPHINGLGQFASYYDAGLGGSYTVQRLFTPQEVGGLDKLYQRFHEKSVDLAFGLSGTLGDRFDWDATVGRAEYQADRTRPRLDGKKVTDYFFGPYLGITGGLRTFRLDLNRYYTALTPAQYASLSTVVTYNADSYVNQAQFVLSGDLFDLPAGPVGFASVLEYSKQGYTLDTDDRLLPTRREIYNLTGTSGGGDRARSAVGVEFSVPILASLKGSVQARFDKYDDITEVDNAKTWGLGLEWRPFKSLLVRSTVSTSFKAPDMHWVFNEGSGSFGNSVDFYRCLQAGLTPATSGACSAATYTYSVFATSKGEPTLQEETGKSFTFGAVWDIADNLSVSADYYDIKLRGAIANLTTAFILEAEGGCRTGLDRSRRPYSRDASSAFCQDIISRVTRIPAPTEPTDRVSEVRSGPQNTALDRNRGVDVAVKYGLETVHWGRVSAELSWTHSLNETYQAFASDPIDKDYRDDPFNYDFRSRVRGSVGLQKNKWVGNVFFSRYGSIPSWGISDARAAQGLSYDRIAPYFLWNVNATYQVIENGSVGLYVTNVFNNFHPKDDTNNTYPYFWRAHSPVGREIALQFNYKFN